MVLLLGLDHAVSHPRSQPTRSDRSAPLSRNRVHVYARQKLLSLCSPPGTELIAARVATDEELLAVHTRRHVDAIDSLATMSLVDCQQLQTTFNSIVLNPATALAARLAAGSLTELCIRVAIDKTHANGFAIIRPPGHHCEAALPYGFCVYVLRVLPHDVYVHGTSRFLSSSSFFCKRLCLLVVCVPWYYYCSSLL